MHYAPGRCPLLCAYLKVGLKLGTMYGVIFNFGKFARYHIPKYSVNIYFV